MPKKVSFNISKRIIFLTYKTISNLLYRIEFAFSFKLFFIFKFLDRQHLKRIEKITSGKVKYDSGKDEFYLRKGNSNLEFNLVAEGIKKAGLLWLLAKNGTLGRGSILFWDEPEANLNPSYISTIAEILLELQRGGVQIFVATHDYFLAKYLDILSKKRDEADRVTYYSLYRSPGDGTTVCEVADEFTLLSNNPIVQTYLQIYRDEVLM